MKNRHDLPIFAPLISLLPKYSLNVGTGILQYSAASDKTRTSFIFLEFSLNGCSDKTFLTATSMNSFKSFGLTTIKSFSSEIEEPENQNLRMKALERMKNKHGEHIRVKRR